MIVNRKKIHPFQSRPVGVHLFLLDRADIVDVDIDREAVQIGMEDVERRAALPDEDRSIVRL